MKPTINLLYYKNLLDLVMIRFFNEFNDFFTKSNGLYVFSKDIPKNKLKSVFKKMFFDELAKYVKQYSVKDINYYFIIGSCLPKDNMILKFKDEDDFPDNVEKLLKIHPTMKYSLKEKDIDIDISLLNDIFISIFNDLFSGKDNVSKHIDGDFRNVMFIMHKNFDCYTMFKIIKWVFGNDNCVNVWKINRLDTMKSQLIAVNEVLSKYIKRKNKLNSNIEFKEQCAEIRKFLFERLNNLNVE